VRTHMTTSELEKYAERALTETLRQVSGMELKDMRRAPAGSGRRKGILARIEVLGHSHTLACAVERSGEPAHLRAALRDFNNRVPQSTEGATRVIIAPHLSPEAQTACNDAGAGFLDLEGNAQLSVGELFIAKRSLAVRSDSGAVAPSRGKSSARVVPCRRFSRQFKSIGNSQDSGNKSVIEGKLCPKPTSLNNEAPGQDAPRDKEPRQRGGL
jgi:hypothetical protein